MLVMFAITAASLLGIIGLLYSFGLVLDQRRSLQGAADAASLAGAWRVLGELQSDNRSDAAVWSSIVSYATRNGVVNDTSHLSATYVDASGADLSTVAAVGSGGRFDPAVRGVRVSVQNPVNTILPGFVRVSQITVSNSATGVVRPTDAPTSTAVAVPVAANLAAAQAAYASHTTFNLFQQTSLPLGLPPTLNFAAPGNTPSPGATSYSSALSDNLQYWSDGQHANGTLSVGGAVALAGAAYYDSIAAGLRDNIRRQALPVDVDGQSYALITVPVWDTADSSSGTVHIAGFMQMKIRAASSELSATAARGIFVPFAVSAAPSTAASPGVDLGAALVEIAS
jgi:Flp pilus assembly protein TadG